MRNRIWYLVTIIMIAAFSVAVARDVLRKTPVPAEKATFTTEPLASGVGGQDILDAIKDAGYPSVDKMSSELKAQIIAAVNSDVLKTLDRDTSNVGFNARLVGITTRGPCYLYDDNDVCLVVIANDKGKLVSYFIDHNDSVREESLSYSLGGFFGSDQYLIVEHVQQNIGGHETGYAVNIKNGAATPIATIEHLVPEGGPIHDPTDSKAEVVEAAVFRYQKHEFAVFISKDPAYTNQHRMVFTDVNGKLLESFTTYTKSNPIGDRLSAIDYQQTENSVKPVFATSDGEEELNGGGLYMWISGGQYYYDPTTGTIYLLSRNLR